MSTIKSTTVFRSSSRHPIRFDRLHPGSKFRIVGEPSRGIYKSRDARIYQKAREHEGFFATELGSNAACCLMPEDLVMPVVSDRRQ